MNKMQKAMRELTEMDELAARSSPIHSLHPAAKLLASIVYILVTLSFDKYDLGGLAPMALWPVLLFQLSGLAAFISCASFCRWSWPSACSIPFSTGPSFCGSEASP